MKMISTGKIIAKPQKFNFVTTKVREDKLIAPLKLDPV